MRGWRAMRDWVAPGGAPDMGALIRAAGYDSPVTVTDTSRQQDGAGPCRDTTLGKFVEWWHSRQQQHRPEHSNIATLSESGDKMQRLVSEPLLANSQQREPAEIGAHRTQQNQHQP